jgi:acyl-CoA synthetase (NDP forming)
VFVEIFKDVSLYPCPINRNEAMMMIEKLKGYKLFQGYRGSKPKDVDALADMMVKLSDYAVANKETLKEVDINPIFVHDQGEGVMAADALIVKM